MLLVGGLITAGCGSSDGDTSPAGSSSTSSPPSTQESTATTTETCAFSGSTNAESVSPGATTRLLNAVDVTATGCVESVTFRLVTATPDAPVGFDVAYADPPFRDSGSGRDVTVPGNAFLVIRMRPAALADLDAPGAPPTYTGPRVIIPTDTTAIRQVAFFDAFEAQLAWVVGLDEERPFRVDSSPDALTVTIGPA